MREEEQVKSRALLFFAATRHLDLDAGEMSVEGQLSKRPALGKTTIFVVFFLRSGSPREGPGGPRGKPGKGYPGLPGGPLAFPWVPLALPGCPWPPKKKLVSLWVILVSSRALTGLA